MLTGGRGNDRVFGQDGADTFPTPTLDGKDEYNGGAGVDHVSYAGRTARVVVQLDGAPTTAIRSPARATTSGSTSRTSRPARATTCSWAASSTTASTAGRAIDLIDGRGGIDQLFGGTGNDTLRALDGTGGDLLNGEADTDTCTSDAGDTEIDCEI